MSIPTAKHDDDIGFAKQLNELNGISQEAEDPASSEWNKPPPPVIHESDVALAKQLSQELDKPSLPGIKEGDAAPARQLPQQFNVDVVAQPGAAAPVPQADNVEMIRDLAPRTFNLNGKGDVALEVEPEGNGDKPSKRLWDVKDTSEGGSCLCCFCIFVAVFVPLFLLVAFCPKKLCFGLSEEANPQEIPFDWAQFQKSDAYRNSARPSQPEGPRSGWSEEEKRFDQWASQPGANGILMLLRNLEGLLEKDAHSIIKKNVLPDTLSPSASAWDEATVKRIRRGYRQATLRVHPDRCTKLAPETQAFYEKVFQTLNNAHGRFDKAWTELHPSDARP